MRLDKWLWCARFYKTRSKASDAIKSGKVQSADKKVKPSHLVKPGDDLKIRQGQFNWEIHVVALTTSRKSAKEAVKLYSESRESLENRALFQQQLQREKAMYPRTRGRPTKRERRDLHKFSRGQ